MVRAGDACAGRLTGYARTYRSWARPAGFRAARTHVARTRMARTHAMRTRMARTRAMRTHTPCLVVARARLAAFRKALVSPWVLGPALVVGAMFLALALVYIHVACVDSGHHIVALQKRLTDLEAENERLQLQVVELTAPNRIEQLASERLGMVRPEVARILAEKPATVAQVPAPTPVRVTWFAKVRAFLTHLVEGQGVLAEPAR